MSDAPPTVVSDGQNGSAPGSAVQRAEALLDRFGERVRQARAEAAKKEDAAKAALADGSAPARPPAERADEMLDRTGEQLGRFASEFGLRVRRFAALAREEAEDMLAEAQSLRRRDMP